MIISAFSLADPGNLGSTFLPGRAPETDHLDPFWHCLESDRWPRFRWRRSWTIRI